MAPPTPPELSASELELKRRGRRRLIGAITLGLLALVFLPMLFDAEPRRDPRTQQQISIQLPAKDALPPLPPPALTAPASKPAAPDTSAAAPEVAKVTALPAPAKKAPDTPPAKTPQAPPAAKTPQALQTPLAPSPQAAPKAAPKAAPTAAAPAAEPKAGFAVQIGAFTDQAKVAQLVARMQQAKLPVSTSPVAIKNGMATRVRVGPYEGKEQAEAALAQVKLNGADGKIVPYP